MQAILDISQNSGKVHELKCNRLIAATIVRNVSRFEKYPKLFFP